MRKIHYLSNLWLVVQAFERDAVRLKLGPPVRITFAAVPGRTFSEKVRLIGKQVNPQSRTIPVRVDVPNEGGLLRPGMSANAWVTPGPMQARFLPGKIALKMVAVSFFLLAAYVTFDAIKTLIEKEQPLPESHKLVLVWNVSGYVYI